MKERPRKTDGFLFAIVLFCVLSFKLILIGVGESGVRADDLLILVAFLLLLLRGDLRRIKRSRPVNLYLLFVLVNLLSALWNSAMGRVSLVLSLFFVVRLLEYLVFYYLGCLVSLSGRRLAPAMTWYLGILVLVVPLQMAGIIPALGSFAGITSRAVGNTNGPYELAVVAAFLLCFLGYRLKGRLKGLAAFALIILSASRITFAATLLSGAKVLFQRTRSKSQFAAALGLVLLAAGLGFAGYSSVSGDSGANIEMLSRLSSAASMAPVSQVAAVYASMPTYRSSADYIHGEFLDAGAQSVAAEGLEGEVSGTIRILRWTSLIKSTLAGVGTTLIGLGPSFGTSAVDGYFVRVFIETGLLGLVAFLAFAVALLRDRRRSSWPFREYVFILLATGLFIDICVSYKPMLLLWLWHGMHQFKATKAADATQPLLKA